MTKKDYELIASVIRRAQYQARSREGQEAIEATIECIAGDMAEALYNENTRFDPTRFMEACGI
jgi:hypothetical protein